jgi:hypothetical protein
MHEFVPGRTKEQLNKEAAEASSAKEENEAQATGSPQGTEAVASHRMFEGKLVLDGG